MASTVTWVMPGGTSQAWVPGVLNTTCWSAHAARGAAQRRQNDERAEQRGVTELHDALRSQCGRGAASTIIRAGPQTHIAH
jgi:hypothetical protein